MKYSNVWKNGTSNMTGLPRRSCKTWTQELLVNWLCSNEKCALLHQYFRQNHKLNTTSVHHRLHQASQILFITIISFIIRVSLFGCIIYCSVDIHDCCVSDSWRINNIAGYVSFSNNVVRETGNMTCFMMKRMVHTTVLVCVEIYLNTAMQGTFFYGMGSADRVYLEKLT